MNPITWMAKVALTTPMKVKKQICFMPMEGGVRGDGGGPGGCSDWGKKGMGESPLSECAERSKRKGFQKKQMVMEGRCGK